jgi:hypothetical protein
MIQFFWILDIGPWIFVIFRTKKVPVAGRVKEGRKGLPLPATGDEKGAFAFTISNPRANSINLPQATDFKSEIEINRTSADL